MRLVEEYLSRHNLNVPVLLHVDNGTLLMREDRVPGSIRWQMLMITLRQADHGPPKYQIRIMHPIHNAYEHSMGRVNFDTILNEELEWDEYERYLLDFVKRPNNPRVIRDNMEVVLTMWEMFVYCQDAHMVKFAGSDDFYNILDTKLPLKDRYQAYQTFLNSFQATHKNLFDIWNREMLQYVKLYCHWLAKVAVDGSGSGAN